MNLKNFVAILITFAWLTPVMAQYDFDAKEKERMAKARVKTQTQWTHDYVDGKPSAKGYKSSVTRYDIKGNITEVINYNETGKIISAVIHQYDSRDKKINLEQYQNNREKLLYSQKTVYDFRGNKTREYGYDGATVYSNTYAYDVNDRLTEINYTMDNVPVEKRKFVYTGNKTEIMVYDPNNNLTFRQENIYNDQGSLISEIRTGNMGNVVHSLNLNYNNAGDLTEEVKLRAGEKLDYQKSYQYDSENRPVREETVNLDGTRFVSYEYQYNDAGDLVYSAWKRTERAREASTKKITYDAKGLPEEWDCYFATYQLKSLYKYNYEFY